jgi:signal peptidase I
MTSWTRFRWLAVCLCLLVGAGGATLVTVHTVHADSMVPTVYSGQVIAVTRAHNLTAFLDLPVRRGDLVVVRQPKTGGRALKRLIGVGGDRIYIADGILFLNGRPVPEPYARHESARLRERDDWSVTSAHRGMRIPEGTIFVLGDNRDRSEDSRSWGVLPKSSLLGRVVFVFPRWWTLWR